MAAERGPDLPGGGGGAHQSGAARLSSDFELGGRLDHRHHVLRDATLMLPPPQRRQGPRRTALQVYQVDEAPAPS